MFSKAFGLRLLADIIVGLVAFGLVRFMHVNESTLIADSLVAILAISFVVYSFVHTFLEHYVISKVSTPSK